MVDVFLCLLCYNIFMHRFFLETKYEENMTLSGQVAHHILDVLRMQKNEEIELVTDDGVIARVKILEIGDGWLKVATQEVLAEPHESKCRVTLAQGLAKGEKMDFVLQKAVELGASRIIPVVMDNCVVKIAEEKSSKKLERWQKIVQSAAQQAKRDRVPELLPISTFAEALQGDYDLRLLAYEGETQVMLKDVLRGSEYKNILVLIGPEGGITEKELELARVAGARTVSLGRRILRTETAGLVVLSNIFYELG